MGLGFRVWSGLGLTGPSLEFRGCLVSRHPHCLRFGVAPSSSERDPG